MFGGSDWHGDHRQEAVRRQQLEREKQDLEYRFQEENERAQRAERAAREIRNELQSEREEQAESIRRLQVELHNVRFELGLRDRFLQEKNLSKKFESWAEQPENKATEGTDDEN